MRSRCHRRASIPYHDLRMKSREGAQGRPRGYKGGGTRETEGTRRAIGFPCVRLQHTRRAAASGSCSRARAAGGGCLFSSGRRAVRRQREHGRRHGTAQLQQRPVRAGAATFICENPSTVFVGGLPVLPTIFSQIRTSGKPSGKSGQVVNGRAVLSVEPRFVGRVVLWTTPSAGPGPG